MTTTPPVAVTLRDIRAALFALGGVEEKAVEPTDEDLERLAHGR